MNKQTAKLIARIVENLPDMTPDVMQGWIENPRGLSRVLAEALCPPKEVVEFPVWKTIKLGTHKSVDELRQSLRDNGFPISCRAGNILGKITLAETETEVTLHVATVEELTGKDVATNHEINQAIRQKGYDLCPAEVGPQLRLQYSNQPECENLLIVMESISDSFLGLRNIFCMGHAAGGERWLNDCSGHPDHGWGDVYCFVFMSRK